MKKFITASLVLGFSFIGLVSVSYANNSWGGYHWARTSNPFVLKVGDNVSSAWDMYLDQAISDWSTSPILDLSKVAGGTTPRNCKATLGRLEVCSERYGNTGWLGIAQIWISGLHITKAVTKVNDTYFNTSSYNTPAWRRLVMCQEIGHDFGLDHQDEIFNNANLGSCMDYTNDPDGGEGGVVNNDPSNEHPNQHDYDEIANIYAHLDGSTTIGQFSTGPGKGAGLANKAEGDEMSDWGKAIRTSGDGRKSLYEKDLGKGEKVFTFVTWAN